MLSPPLLKVQKLKLYFNYMHASSVLQYFQFLFIPFYTVFSLFLSC
ncbi:NADH dehydrogenase [Bacillus cereus]|uniref:NADH dehydrogenase n=1 Tax=Bacillus cereus TaxID=1396 RepID=A0A9X6GCW5_BACCE|nr:NADH dehydrogenase [Bacillus sp. MB366]OOR71775.1 NADH dehydrogenase [Bacillus cereus]OPA07092.1 NADH dehydrogenase [Bacillus cereus]OPA20057.1 NADH dehydrogenase [Bacillus cereus]OPA21173.1 NADH dehydrogenase [Bacillus cereus]